MKTLINLLTQMNIWLMVAGFVAASLLYCTNIILRFFSVGALTWVDQITGYLFAVAPLLGACLAIRTDENIKIDILSKKITNKRLIFFSKLVCFFVSIIFVWLFYEHFHAEWTRDANKLGFIQQWMLDIPYLFLFFSASVFFLESAYKAITEKE